MHSIITTDGAYRQSKFLRVARTISYTFFAMAGAAFVLSDVLTTFYGITSEVMAWFIMIGAVVGAIGTASRMWVGEFIGLPLLGTGLLVLGIEVRWSGDLDNYPLVVWGNLFILTGMAALVIARWWMVVHVYRAVRSIAQKEAGREYE